MKRRTFLLTTAVATLAVISVPVVKYYGRKSYHPLEMPDELRNFCDEKTIRDIGISYRNLTPKESEKKKLTEILLTDYDGKLTAVSDKSKIIELLDKKTIRDFQDNEIHVLNGWVISKTEARQCALFSLI